MIIDAEIHNGGAEGELILREYLAIMQDPETEFTDADGAEDFAPRRTAKSCGRF